MLHNKTTTYILLERGVEDVNLINEIKAVERRMVAAGTNPYVMFPALVALRQALETEITDGEV